MSCIDEGQNVLESSEVLLEGGDGVPFEVPLGGLLLAEPEPEPEPEPEVSLDAPSTSQDGGDVGKYRSNLPQLRSRLGVIRLERIHVCCQVGWCRRFQ